MGLNKITKSALTKAYWVQGKTLSEIAKIYGCTAASIWARMERLGIARRSTGPIGHGKLNETKVKSIRKRLAAGETGGAIAKDMGVSRQAVNLVKKGQIWGHVA